MQTNYYAVLEIARDATEEEVKKAYRRLALQYHPDTNQGNPETEEKFKEINEAYGVLGDKGKRRQYDTFGRAGLNEGKTPGAPFGAGFSPFGRGFGGGFCRGRGRGMGRGCGMGRFSKDPWSSYGQEMFHPFSGGFLDLLLTSEEAMSGVEKEILLQQGRESRRVLVRVPPGLDNGSILQMRGVDLGEEERDLLLRVSIVD